MCKWLVSFSIALTLLASPAYSQTESEKTIRKEIDQLTKEVTQRLEKIIALEAQLRREGPFRGYEGYCPVSLVEKRDWVRGSPKHAVKHEGITYLFASQQRKARFEASPEKYIPLLSGYDPVQWLEHGKRVRGRRQYGFFYRDRIVLLSSRKSLKRFSNAPDQYSPTIDDEPILLNKLIASNKLFSDD